jgi:hypothetical protein
MECVKLLSEGFESAVSSFRSAVEIASRLDTVDVEGLRRVGETFTADVEEFAIATEQQRLNINNYVRVQNMVAENLQALAEGKPRPYAPNAFLECLTPKVAR